MCCLSCGSHDERAHSAGGYRGIGQALSGVHHACDVQVKATFAEDPKPAGSVESEAYHLMSETIYDIFGKETLIVPNLMLGRLTLEITRRYRIMSSVSAAA